MEELLKKYNEKKTKSAKFNYYFDNIRPVIIEKIKNDLQIKKNTNQVNDYKSLVIILGHNVIPSIITSLVGLAEKIYIVTDSNKFGLFKDKYYSAVVESIQPENIKLIEVSPHAHADNLNIINNLISEICSQGKVLCDITSGKKILAAQLAIAAKGFGQDICYIDANEYIDNSSIPVPGKETLFIQNSQDCITEISTEKSKIIINYVPGKNEIIYNIYDGINYYIEKSGITSDTTVQEIMKLLNEFNIILNKNIITGRESTNEIDNLASSLDAVLCGQLKKRSVLICNNDTEFVIDPQLSGIPWEIIFARKHNFKIPIFRKLNIDFDTQLSSSIINDGVLFIEGAGENIPYYDDTIKKMKRYFSENNHKVKIITAESKGKLMLELAGKKYFMIFYYGHSVFGKNLEDSGWLCSNGEIFSASDLSIFSSNAPSIIVSNSCQSAKVQPFFKESFIYNSFRNGVRTFIGTGWLLESERAVLFMEFYMHNLLTLKKLSKESFRNSITLMKDKYPSNDILFYNYIYYGE